MMPASRYGHYFAPLFITPLFAIAAILRFAAIAAITPRFRCRYADTP